MAPQFEFDTRHNVDVASGVKDGKRLVRIDIGQDYPVLARIWLSKYDAYRLVNDLRWAAEQASEEG
jgi:hypothetical protein